jgi:2'-5' RNA ligase
MRLFTALDLPSEMLLRLEQLLSPLRPLAPVKWSTPDNLHVTTKFIGAWPDARLDELDAALEKLRFRDCPNIEITGLGWFPDARSPRSFYAAVQGGAALHHLAADTEQALEAMGIAKEPRAFLPHLTLARIQTPVSLQALHAKVEELQTVSFGSYRAPGFYLYRSDPGSGASIYHKIRTYSFQDKP